MLPPGRGPWSSGYGRGIGRSLTYSVRSVLAPIRPRFRVPVLYARGSVPALYASGSASVPNRDRKGVPHGPAPRKSFGPPNLMKMDASRDSIAHDGEWKRSLPLWISRGRKGV
jgi:hypothetical protein